MDGSFDLAFIQKIVGDATVFHNQAWDGVLPRGGGLGRGREVLIIVDGKPEDACADAARLG